MSVMGDRYDKSAIIPIICIINNSAELSLDDNKAINEAMRSFYEILCEKSMCSRFCEAKISVIGLSGDNLRIADNCEMIHFFWDDHKSEGKTRWNEAMECLDDQLFEYMRHLLLSPLIYRPIVLFFTTSDSIPKAFSISLKKSASIKDIVTTFMVTPESSLEKCKSLNKVIPNEEFVVKTSEMEKLKEFVVFSKTKNPFYGEELNPPDNARFLIRNGSDCIDVLDAFSLTCCQIGPCEPTMANEIAFEIKPVDDCIEVTNKWKDCIVTIFIEAGSERTIENCIGTKLGLNISNKKEYTHDLNIVINGTDSTMTVKNVSNDKCSVRMAFPVNGSIRLINNDRIEDVASDTIYLSVEAIKYEDIAGFSRGDIPDGWITGDDGWD